MYEPHPLLRKPPPNALLWRYMDFTKFLALLETSTLHFTQLAKFEDPFEGYPPRSLVTVDRDLSRSMTGMLKVPNDPEFQRMIDAGREASYRSHKTLAYANCWHENDSESAAMWSLYLRSGEGIAIRTNPGRLFETLDAAQLKYFGGMVDYVDYETYSPSTYDRHDTLQWAILKRTSFAHEREFRLMLLGDYGSEGRDVPIDLALLIESVWVSAAVPNWVFDVVGKVASRYKLSCRIVRSKLGAPPDYLDDSDG